MNRENRNFEPCPPGVLQWRRGGFIDGREGQLWRIKHCNYDRWHYTENPCNCYRNWRPTVMDILLKHGYTIECVEAITGTWKRDGQYIANATQRFREQISQRRELEAVASAARGPQRLMPTFFDFDTFIAYCWRDA